MFGSLAISVKHINEISVYHFLYRGPRQSTLFGDVETHNGYWPAAGILLTTTENFPSHCMRPLMISHTFFGNKATLIKMVVNISQIKHFKWHDACVMRSRYHQNILTTVRFILMGIQMIIFREKFLMDKWNTYCRYCRHAIPFRKRLMQYLAHNDDCTHFAYRISTRGWYQLAIVIRIRLMKLKHVIPLLMS